MKKIAVTILVVLCVIICASKGFAWSDDVEGMLMPSQGCADNMSDPDAVMENIEPTEDTSSENITSEDAPSGNETSSIDWE